MDDEHYYHYSDNDEIDYQCGNEPSVGGIIEYKIDRLCTRCDDGVDDA